MRIRLSRSIVPNLFTVLNIFFGFLCMIHAVQGKFVVAAWYIILSAICDTLDGFMARLTNSASEFGVELDSLADVVSFGVAPSFMLYALVLDQYGTFGALVAAVPLIMGALRLARFNVQLVGFSKDYFTGMLIGQEEIQKRLAEASLLIGLRAVGFKVRPMRRPRPS